MSETFELRVNGQSYDIAAPAATPLIYVLRNELGLTGTRFGCGLEQCGSCMVLIDGLPGYACTRALGSVAGADLQIVEDLATHPLQQAFVAEQAGQCGYCLSGILISAKALLDENPRPSREDIITALDGHLCRCGAHVRIIQAVQRAAVIMAEEVGS